MLSNHQSLWDFKENGKYSKPVKTNISHSRKGLKSRSLNSFNDTANVTDIKKHMSQANADECKILFNEKENSKPKTDLVQDSKIFPKQDDWSDIEEMHIYIDPDDDYEDIMPKCDRINRKDVDSLFMSFTYTNFTELSERLPSPLPPEIDDVDFPPFSPSFPEVKASLFDDTPLDFIPLP